MPKKINIDEYLSSIDAKSIAGLPPFGDYKGPAKVMKLERHISQKSGNMTIKITFGVDGRTFASYLPLTDRMKDLTIKRLGFIAVSGGLSKDDFMAVAKKAYEEDGVDTDKEFAGELARRLSVKIEKGEINKVLQVERFKPEGSDFWNVKIDWAGEAK